MKYTITDAEKLELHSHLDHAYVQGCTGCETLRGDFAAMFLLYGNRPARKPVPKGVFPVYDRVSA